MKVLHVVATASRRGAEIFAADLIRYLRDSDIDQRVMVLRSSPMDVSFAAPVMPITFRKQSRALLLRPLPALRRTTRDWRPDVIQAHGGEALKHVVLSGAGGHACLVYRRIGASPATLGSSRMRRRAYAELMARTRCVVTVADAVRTETISRFGMPGERVVTIPNGVDPIRLEQRRSGKKLRGSLGISDDQQVLLSVGSLSWEKDPLAHIAAASMAIEEDPRIIHVLVGDGPLLPQARREVARRGIGERCRFLGLRTDIGDIMRASDVLLFASRPDGMEGMPAVLIEAAMVGLPVAAFDIGGVSEVVEDGETGFLVPWRDIRGLAAASLRVLNDPQLAAQLSVAASARSLRFEIDQIGSRYLSLYESLVA